MAVMQVKLVYVSHFLEKVPITWLLHDFPVLDFAFLSALKHPDVGTLPVNRLTDGGVRLKSLRTTSKFFCLNVFHNVWYQCCWAPVFNDCTFVSALTIRRRRNDANIVRATWKSLPVTMFGRASDSLSRFRAIQFCRYLRKLVNPGVIDMIHIQQRCLSGKVVAGLRFSWAHTFNSPQHSPVIVRAR